MMKIIGIVGPSCSGKSTVAKRIVNILKASTLSIDNFYKRHSPEYFVDFDGEQIRTFERPDLWDGKRLADTIKTIKEKGAVKVMIWNPDLRIDEEIEIKKTEYFVVEGFLLYVYPEINAMLDFMFYLDLSSDKCVARRISRARDKFTINFVKIGMREYEKYGLKQRDIEKVVVIDADKDVDEIVDKILKIVKN